MQVFEQGVRFLLLILLLLNTVPILYDSHHSAVQHIFSIWLPRRFSKAPFIWNDLFQLYPLGKTTTNWVRLGMEKKSVSSSFLSLPLSLSFSFLSLSLPIKMGTCETWNICLMHLGEPAMEKEQISHFYSFVSRWLLKCRARQMLFSTWTRCLNAGSAFFYFFLPSSFQEEVGWLDVESKPNTSWLAPTLSL